MASEQYGPFRAHKAAADLTAKRYHFVALAAASAIAVPAAGARTLGVLTDAPKVGVTGTVQITDRAKVIAGAAFAVGTELTPNAAGAAVAAVAGDYVSAIAVEAATQAGQIVSVEVRHYKI